MASLLTPSPSAPAKSASAWPSVRNAPQSADSSSVKPLRLFSSALHSASQPLSLPDASSAVFSSASAPGNPPFSPPLRPFLQLLPLPQPASRPAVLPPPTPCGRGAANRASSLVFTQFCVNCCFQDLSRFQPERVQIDTRRFGTS